MAWQRDVVTPAAVERHRRGRPRTAVAWPQAGGEISRAVQGGRILHVLLGLRSQLRYRANSHVDSNGLGSLQDNPRGAARLEGGLMKIAVLGIALFAGMSVVGGAVTQPPAGCAPGRICLYQDFAYRGPVSLFSPNTPNLGPANDQASSVFNATPGAVFLYDDPSYRGARICVNPDTGINDLALFGRNDSISSIGVGPAGGCG